VSLDSPHGTTQRSFHRRHGFDRLLLFFFSSLRQNPFVDASIHRMFRFVIRSTVVVDRRHRTKGRDVDDSTVQRGASHVASSGNSPSRPAMLRRRSANTTARCSRNARADSTRIDRDGVSNILESVRERRAAPASARRLRILRPSRTKVNIRTMMDVCCR
jgi:hypothetical protein